ncbi:MAG: sulfite exporter TauE/SafE family protein [Planctomycetota bacterium]|nr:sulfite exporter TauE/SafE family protein [Planctomycetota bacterium]
MTMETWYVAAVVFLGTLVRSTFGFGDALVAMPLLTFVVSMQVATPVVAVASAVVAIWVTIQDWQKVKVGSAWRLAASSCIGIPLGVYLLVQMPEVVVKGVLAAVIIGFAGYRLLSPRLLRLNNDRWAFGFGYTAGLLGGAYNAQGPPIVIYGVMQGWSATSFRATMQGFFVPTTMVLLVCHWQAGLWTREVGLDVLVALPFVVLAIPIGKYFNRRLEQGRFERYVDLLLLVIGIALLVNIVLAVASS